jgi:hypothetical protein
VTGKLRRFISVTGFHQGGSGKLIERDFRFSAIAVPQDDDKLGHALVSGGNPGVNYSGFVQLPALLRKPSAAPEKSHRSAESDCRGGLNPRAPRGA